MEKIFLFFESVVFDKQGNIFEGVRSVFDFIKNQGDQSYIFLNSEKREAIVKDNFQENKSLFVVSGKENHEETIKRLRAEQLKDPWNKKTILPVGSRMGIELLSAVRMGLGNLIHITEDENEWYTKNPFGIYRILVTEKMGDIIENYPSLR